MWDCPDRIPGTGTALFQRVVNASAAGLPVKFAGEWWAALVHHPPGEQGLLAASAPEQLQCFMCQQPCCCLPLSAPHTHVSQAPQLSCKQSGSD